MNKLVVVFLILGLYSCKPTTPEFYETDSGLKYKYHDIMDEGETPQSGNCLIINLDILSNKGDVLYTSDNHRVERTDMVLIPGENEHPIEAAFKQFKIGDSVSVYLSAESFFNNYLHDNLPDNLNAEDEIELRFRIVEQMSKSKYLYQRQLQNDELELAEFELIQSYLESWEASVDSIYNYDGVMMSYNDTCDTKRIKYGDLIQVKYKISYLDGTVIYDNTEQESGDEFNAGMSGQTIEGFKTALLHMCYNQEAKALIPSFLGFSKNTIKSGLVSGHEPFLFEIKEVTKQ